MLCVCVCCVSVCLCVCPTALDEEDIALLKNYVSVLILRELTLDSSGMQLFTSPTPHSHSHPSPYPREQHRMLAPLGKWRKTFKRQ